MPAPDDAGGTKVAACAATAAKRLRTIGALRESLATLLRLHGVQDLAQRIDLLRRALAQALQAANGPHRAELQLVEETCGPLDAARRMTGLAGLRAEFRAKRNFVAGPRAR